MKLIFSAVFHNAQGEGEVWEVCAMQEGEITGRKQYISADALKASVPAFQNAWVQNLIWQNGFQDHLPDSARNVFPDGVVIGNVVGIVENARAETLENGRTGIIASFRPADETLKKTLLLAQKAGKLNSVGLSINGSADEGHIQPTTLPSGARGVEITQIDHIDSIDLVTNPGGGGYFRALLASAAGVKRPAPQQGDTTTMRKLLKQLLEAKGIPYRDGSALNILASVGIHAAEGEEPAAELSPEDEKLFTSIYNAIQNGMNDLAESVVQSVMNAMQSQAEPDPESVKASAGADGNVPSGTDDMDKKMRQLDLRLSQLRVQESLNAEDSLPAAVKTILASKFSGQIVDEVTVKQEIEMQKKILASATDSGKARNFGTDVDFGLEGDDKMQIALHKLFQVQASGGEKSSWQGVAPFRSLKAAYHQYTGDGERVIGRMIKASSFATAGFPEVMANTLGRRLINLYQAAEAPWRKLVNIRPGGVADFREQSVVQVGGLEDLTPVAEDGTYDEATANSSDDAKYSVDTRGKILAITRRVIKNDDIGFVQRLLKKANRAAHRTLQKFVFDLYLCYGGSTPAINGGIIYDGKALYHADHSNIQTGSFSYDNVLALSNLINAQTEADSNEPLDLEGKYLIIPKELKQAGLVYVKSEGKPGTANNDANIFVVDNEEDLIVVDKTYLRGDANNYYMSVDPNVYETIELGFMDGREEPELWLQDAPTAGTVFTNDRIRYKVRHEYGGCVVDYRGLAASIVANP